MVSTSSSRCCCGLRPRIRGRSTISLRLASPWSVCRGRGMYPRGEGGGLGPWWFEGGEGVSTNPYNHLFLRRGQRMQIAPIHHWHAKNRIPRIPLHFVSGPWTSIVAALDGGRSNIAVCRRYNLLIHEKSIRLPFWQECVWFLRNFSWICVFKILSFSRTIP